MAASSTSNKPSYQTLEVILDSGEKVRVRRTPQSNLKRLIELQGELVGKYLEVNGAISELFVQDDIVALIKEYLGLLPIQGKDETYLDYEDLKENWEQLVRLVFNGSIDEKTRKVEGTTEPEVSKLHFLPFELQLQNHYHQWRLNQGKLLLEREKEIESLVEANKQKPTEDSPN
jgi:hypothetical protein